MKCKQCGSNLNIEDRFCPYCGTPNPFAVEHQREMDEFTKEFNETKEQVISTTGAKSRRAGRITVVAVLALLVSIMFILNIFSSDIRYWREDKKVEENRLEYTQVVENYMSAGDYLGLYSFTDAKRISWSESFRDYEKVFSASRYYSNAYDSCIQLMQYSYQDYNYSTSGEICEDIAENLHNVFENSKKQKYDRDEYYAGNKKAYIEGSVEQAKLLAKTVFGLNDEEAESLPTLSEARLNVLLEEHYEKKNQK